MMERYLGYLKAIIRTSFLLLALASLVACVGQPNGVDSEDVGPTTDPEILVDPLTSTVTVSNTSVNSGSSITVTVQVFNISGELVTANIPVSFSLDSGTSTLNFGSVTNNGDGTFSATATGFLAGTPAEIGASANGTILVTTKPSVQVSPGPIAAATSQVSVSASAMLQGNAVTATLQARDAAGNTITTGGETISFNLSGGTAGGSFGGVTDNGDGTYDSVFTSNQFGSGSSISALIDATPVSDTEAIEVFLAEYQRTISLSAATSLAEYQVKITLNAGNFNYAQAAADGSVVRFTDLSGNLLSYWIEVWDPAGDSIIWVQLPTSGTSSFYMYSGNINLADSSDAINTFSYSTAQASYAELNPQSNNQTMRVASYGAGNSVTVETNSGPVNQTIGLNSFSDFSNAVQGLISSVSPIAGRQLYASRAHDSIVPMSFKGTQFGYARSRGSDSWHFYNPGPAVATITVNNFNNSGASGGSNTVFNINPGEFGGGSGDVNYFGLVEASAPVIGFYRQNNSDGMVLVPAHQELIGINSNDGNIGCMVDGTNLTKYGSDGSSVAATCDRGDVVDIGNTGSQGAAPAYHIVSDQPIIAHSQADSDGSESGAFFPTDELNTEYLIPGDIQYLAVATLYNSTITVYEQDGTFFDSQALASDGINPAKHRFGNGSNTVAITGGARIISDKPFFVYYEYSTQDETNAMGMKQARKVVIPEPTTSVGSATDLL